MHWRQSAINSAGAVQGGGRGIFTSFYTINFRGGCKSGGAHAPAAPPSSAPMSITFTNCMWKLYMALLATGGKSTY